VLGRIVEPFPACVFVGEGVGVLPGGGVVAAGAGVAEALAPGAGVAVLPEPGPAGFPGFDAPGGVEPPPPPPPHAAKDATSTNVASALARRNAEFANVVSPLRQHTCAHDS